MSFPRPRRLIYWCARPAAGTPVKGRTGPDQRINMCLIGSIYHFRATRAPCPRTTGIAQRLLRPQPSRSGPVPELVAPLSRRSVSYLVPGGYVAMEASRATPSPGPVRDASRTVHIGVSEQ